MPDLMMVAESSIAPMPTSVKLESEAMRMISLTELSASMAAAISGVEASSGAGMSTSRALKMLERALGR